MAAMDDAMKEEDGSAEKKPDDALDELDKDDLADLEAERLEAGGDDDALMTAPPSSWDREQAPDAKSKVAGSSEKNARKISDEVKAMLKAGRLNVTCIEGKNIKRPDMNEVATKLDAYLQLKLGAHRGAPIKKTNVQKRSSQNPNFKREKVYFDLVDPEEFCVYDDIQLTVEIWDDNAWNDDLMGTVSFSVLRFFGLHEPEAQWFPVRRPDGEESEGSIYLEFAFEPARPGLAVIHLYEGRNLTRLGEEDITVELNPFVSGAMGEVGTDVTSSTEPVQSGGSNPYFGDSEVLLWVDQENWVNDVHLQVWNADLGRNEVLGEVHFPLLKYMQILEADAEEEEFELVASAKQIQKLQGTDGVDEGAVFRVGEIVLKVTFLPAGVLSVHIKEGNNIRAPDDRDRMDPYLRFNVEGQAAQIQQMSRVDKDGGTNPTWNQTIDILIVDSFLMEVELWIHELVGSELLLGKVDVSLLQVFKRGIVDTWITAKEDLGHGNLKSVGDIHLVMEFNGPPTIAFPQHRTGVDTFDDSKRVNRKKADEEKELEEAAAAQALEAAQIAPKREEDPNEVPLKRDTTWTEEEIKAAFDFIDLDHNQFIGAAELRHCLVCMGELITDEEVDMMISIVDDDGDGQVSFEEFYELITDPDPARQDFRTRRPKGGPGDKNKNLTADAFQRQKENSLREQKKVAILAFLEENEIDELKLHRAVDTLRNMADAGVGVGPDSSIRFETFCKIFEVEPTGEYVELFRLFADPDNEGVQETDAKLILLGFSNFLELKTESRVAIIFDLFDEDKSGFLSEGELLNVLMANHMQSLNMVKNKARTIMKFTDKDGSGTLSMSEFMLVAAKFPNVLFPALRNNDQIVVKAD